MIKCTKEILFCAAHRLWYHPGKCFNIHGHNYKVAITAINLKSCILDQTGMVVDFGEIKKLVGSWIDKNWDHAILLNTEDPLCSALKDGEYHVFSFPGEPTSERMAEYLLKIVCPSCFKFSDLKIISVRVWETDSCYATAELLG